MRRIRFQPGPIVIATVTVVAVHVTLWLLHHLPDGRVLWGDEETYLASARAWLDGRLPLGELLWPPLYGRVLAGWIGLGGGSLQWVHLCQVLLLGLCGLLVADLGRRWLGSRWSGRVAAGLCVGFPPLAAYAYFLWPEVLHLFLLLSAWWILSGPRRRRPGWLALLGIVLGLALLTKSLLGPFLPVLLAPVLLGRGPARIRIARGLLVTAVIGATLAPVLVTHARLHGKWVVADSGRFNLWLGLNDTSRRNFRDEIVGQAYREYTEAGDDPRLRDRMLERRIRDRVRQVGPGRLLIGQLGRQYFRLFDKDSFLTDQLPGGAIAGLGAGYRTRSETVASILRAVCYLSYGLVLAALPWGVALLPRSAWRRMAVPLAFVGYNIGLFLVLHVKTRYRVPLLPVFFLLSAYSLSPQGRSRWARLGRGGKLGAFACSILLLWLAFGAAWMDAP